MLDILASLTFGETLGNIQGTTAIVSSLERAPPHNANGGIDWPNQLTDLALDLYVLFDASGATLRSAFPRLRRALIRAAPQFRAANGRVHRYIERRTVEGQAALDAGQVGEASDNVLDLMLIRAGQVRLVRSASLVSAALRRLPADSRAVGGQ